MALCFFIKTIHLDLIGLYSDFFSQISIIQTYNQPFLLNKHFLEGKTRN